MYLTPHTPSLAAPIDEEPFLVSEVGPPISQGGPLLIINFSGTGTDETSDKRNKAIFQGKKPEAHELISKLNSCFEGINIKQHNALDDRYRSQIEEYRQSPDHCDQMFFNLDGPGTESFGGSYEYKNDGLQRFWAGFTGRGIEKNTDYAKALTQYYLQRFYNGASLRGAIFIAWSRGVIAALETANEFNSFFPGTPIYVFGIDPVPGPFLPKEYELTENIKELNMIINGSSGHRVGYSPIYPDRLVNKGMPISPDVIDINPHRDSSARVKYYSLPGIHNSSVLQLADPISPEANYIYDVSVDLLRRFLERHQVALTSCANKYIKKLTDDERLLRLDFLRKNWEHLTSSVGVRKWRGSPQGSNWLDLAFNETSALKQLKLNLEVYSNLMLGKYSSNSLRKITKENFFIDSIHEKAFKLLFPELYSYIFSKPYQKNSFNFDFYNQLTEFPKTFSYINYYRLFAGYDNEMLEVFSYCQVSRLNFNRPILFTDLFPKRSQQYNLVKKCCSDLLPLLMQRMPLSPLQYKEIKIKFPFTYQLFLKACILAAD